MGVYYVYNQYVSIKYYGILASVQLDTKLPSIDQSSTGLLYSIMTKYIKDLQ